MENKTKILFLTHFDIKDYEGVSKKILYQVEALKKLGCICELCYKKRNENNVVKKLYFSDIELEKYGKSLIEKLKSIINYKLLLKYILKEKYNTVYIRYYKEANPFFIKFLKNLKKNNIKIIIEIPTYPYDLEQNSKKIYHRIFYLIERKYRLKMKNYVDKIVTFSKDEFIFNIPCLNISNGINLNEIKLIKNEKHNSINFISVSTCFFWHGIDRFLYSLLKYKKNRGKEKIKFYIIGEGNETPKLKKIVEENIELQNVVIFSGYKSGKELEKIYDKVDIAVGSLGIHRLKLQEVQPLKNREYCAKGLPFIISFNDPSFENKDFVFKVSSDEKLFNIDEIITWYKNLKISAEEIREYSKQFTWDIQMKKIVEYLEEKN